MVVRRTQKINFRYTSKKERLTKKPYLFLNEQIDRGRSLWVHRLLGRMFHVAVRVQWGLEVRGVGWPVHYGTWHLPCKDLYVASFWLSEMINLPAIPQSIVESGLEIRKVSVVWIDYSSNKNFRTFQDLKQLNHYLIVRLRSLELCLNLHSDPTVFWRINLSATD